MKPTKPKLERIPGNEFRHAIKNVLLKQTPQRKEYENASPSKEQVRQKYKLVRK